MSGLSFFEFKELLFRCQVLGHLPDEHLADTARFLIVMAEEDADSLKEWAPRIIRIVGTRKSSAAKMFRMLMSNGNKKLSSFLYECTDVSDLIKRFGVDWIFTARKLYGINSLEEIQSFPLDES